MPDRRVDPSGAFHRRPFGAGGRIAAARSALTRTPAATLRWALEASLLLVLAIQLANLVWALIEPVGPFGASAGSRRPELPASQAQVASAFQGASGPAAVSSLQGFTLFGVRHQAGGGSTAILADASGTQVSVAVGGWLAPGVRLHSVGHDHVLLDQSGRRTRLDMPARSSPAPLGSVATSLPSSPRAAAEGSGGAATAPSGAVDFTRLIGEAGLRPRMDAGRVTGYTLVPRGAGAELRRAGLLAGDVLLSINGQQLTPERMGEINELLASGESAQITLERGAERLTLKLDSESP